MDFFLTIQFYNESLIKKEGHKNKYFLKFMMLRTAGGLFVFQSFVFRNNEKLHNAKQGLALTKKDTAIPPRYRRIPKKGDFNTPSVFPFLK